MDDSTKYCYVYLLKSKDEAIEKFVLYKNELSINSKRKLKCSEVIEVVSMNRYLLTFVLNMEL